MAVKDYKVEQGIRAIVVNAKGRIFKLNKLPPKVANSLVIGTNTFVDELGNSILHIWID